MVRILVVEDVDEMRELFTQMIALIPNAKLSRAVESAPEARMEISRRRPNLIILDEVLPGESGLDFLESLKDDPIPVILVTGVEDEKRLSLPVPAGAATRLRKPDFRDLDEAAARFAEAIKLALKT